MTSPSRNSLGVLLLVLALPLPARAQETQKLRFSGDFRFRTELDRSSTKSDGSERDDRDRLRFRARLGLTYQYDEAISFGVRTRSGVAGATQSPHITLGQEFTPKSIHLDKAYAQVASESGSFWLGKNSLPLWKQNEFYWDDDAIPEGIGGSYSFEAGSASATAAGGYFVLDSPGSNTFADQAKLLAGQFSVRGSAGSAGSAGIRVGAGLLVFRENPNQDDPRLENLDYTLAVVSLQVNTRFGDRPVTLGGDLMSNLEKYPENLHNHDQTTGFVASVRTGGLSSKGSWLLGYYYAHIQKYAVVGRYAQDDWVRWGSATATRSSNFAGHEIRVARALGVRNNLVARLYVVEGIETESATALSKEDGVRFRLDWNIGF